MITKSPSLTSSCSIVRARKISKQLKWVENKGMECRRGLGYRCEEGRAEDGEEQKSQGSVVTSIFSAIFGESVP